MLNVKSLGVSLYSLLSSLAYIYIDNVRGLGANFASSAEHMTTDMKPVKGYTLTNPFIFSFLVRGGYLC
jgi:hypothetical protein